MTVSRNEAISMFREVKQKAFDLFQFDSFVNLNFRNIGTIAGYAHYKTPFLVEINTQLLNAPRSEVYETLVHEMAHIVCHATGLGRNHDKGWKRVCIALGGSGSRTHSLRLTPKRRTRQAVYDLGHKTIKVGLTQHRRLQSNPNYRLTVKACGSNIERSMFTGKIVQKG